MFIQNISAKLADSEADTTEFWSDVYKQLHKRENS